MFVSLQIIIVQLADVAFATKGLSLEQWLWCVFFGVGTLIWGQVRTSTPDLGISFSFSPLLIFSIKNML